jgi:2,4-dienoyl-CoA reductase-like NADH-dependent reductase (Old Yellow Enzyme family)
MAEYYSQRASAGLIISEATAVSEIGYGWFGAPGIYTNEQAQGWKLSVDAVHENGGKIFAQLWHMGRQAHSSFNSRGKILSPSAILVTGKGTIRDKDQNECAYEAPVAMTLDEIAETVEDYGKAASFAQQAGFDGVEIHGANGYLIDTFLQSSTNKRTDAYGGSVENRMRFLIDVIQRVKQVYPADRIGVRLSPNGVFGGMGSHDNDVTFPTVAAALREFGLAYLHVMDGLNFGFHNLCKPVTLFDMKKGFQGPMMGNITYTKDTAEGAIRSGAADLIAFGRPFISNPDLVERFRNKWPLEPDAPYAAWYGRSANPQECLEGYTTYKKHQL